jgi:hypothetical protein
VQEFAFLILSRGPSGARFAQFSIEGRERQMKFSREFRTEDEARVQEATLQASGYSAWHTHKADGSWEVFWFVRDSPARIAALAR